MTPREALEDVLSRIEGRVATTGPAAGLILLDSMADAIEQGLAALGYSITRTAEVPTDR